MSQKNTLYIILLIILFNVSSFAQWKSVGLNDQYVWTFAVIDSNIFAGSGGGGIFLSSNNGTNWTQINSGLTNFVINALVVSPNGTNIFAGTAKGIFLSKDNGTNWVSIDSGLTNQYVWSLFISDTNLFAGTEKGVFLSTNNGANWKQLG
ncbi:MAG: WD40/YVTN/BNR-like repeat-containing protein, partial [Ignavibacteriaceae bacterium]